MEYLSEEFLQKFSKVNFAGDFKESNYGNYLSKFENKISKLEYKEKLKECNNLADVIQILKPFFQWEDIPVELLNVFKKRSDLSAHSLASCNNLNSKNLKETAKHINRALAYAESPEDLCLSYYKRALLLQQLNDPIGALEEFQLALKIRDTLPAGGNVKLGRNLKSKLINLQNLAQQQKQTETSSDWTNEKEARQKFSENLFQLRSPHSMAPAMEDFIEIKFNPLIGRHLVLTKDVPIGTTLLVETPFVTVLDSTLKLESGNCHHCLAKNLQCVPCPGCVFAFFCDSNCLANSTPYHQYECPCLPSVRLTLSDGENTQAFYLAFKLICKLGPRKLYQLFENNNNHSTNSLDPKIEDLNTEKKTKIPGTNPTTGIYEKDSYLPILHLTSNSQIEEIELTLPLTAMILTKILDLNTNYFKDFPPTIKSQLMDFVSEMILHHFLTFCQNAYGLCEMEKLEGLQLLDDLQIAKNSKLKLGYSYYGRGVFGTASLINHACVPNVTRFTGLTYGKTTFVALQSLKKGEELVISYIPTFNSFNSHEISRMGTLERQKDLQLVYNFICQCIACLDNWPTILDLEFTETQFKCSNSSLLFNTKINICTNCDLQKNCSGLEMTSKFLDYQKSIKIYRDKVMSNEPVEVIQVLKGAMEFFERNVKAPCHDLFLCQNLFDKAIELVIYFSK